MWFRIAIACLSAFATGCLPYTVGSTARTVPAGQSTRTATVYFIPNAVDLSGDSVAAPLRGADVEMRFGLDERSDIGLRFPSYSGAIINYKRRIAGTTAPDSPALAFMAGGGIVNWGEHGETELTLIASGRDNAVAAPYGGLRVMQVIPLSSSAVHDSPTAGGFFGMRFRFAEMDVSPEIGVYYDRSALDIRSTNYIIVPGVSLTPRGSRSR